MGRRTGGWEPEPEDLPAGGYCRERADTPGWSDQSSGENLARPERLGPCFVVSHLFSECLERGVFRAAEKRKEKQMKTPKKSLAALLAMTLTVGLTACSGETDSQSAQSASSQPAQSASSSHTQEESGFPFTLTTKDGQEVTFTHVPETIISCNPNAGDELMALGLGDKIIATAYNNTQVNPQWREEYEAIPTVAESYISLETHPLPGARLRLRPLQLFQREEQHHPRHPQRLRHHVPVLHRRLHRGGRRGRGLPGLL